MDLFYKLIQYNVYSTTLFSLCAMYRNSHSQVRCQGLLSSSFPVLQGTKQAGKTSPLIYLVYINGLIEELEASGQGLCVFNRYVCSPTVADDMVLVLLSKAGMDCMLNICSEYARKWHYFYNSSNCEVVVFNQRMPIQPLPRFSMGQNPIKESERYRHLGAE